MTKYFVQGVPTIEEGKLLLKEAENLFPGPWIKYSLWAAEATKLIDENCGDLNPEGTYVYVTLFLKNI